MAKENKDKKIGFFRKLFKNFYPTYRYDKVENIPYSLIEKDNIKLIMIDMDNTIIDFNKREYSKEIKEWAERMNRNGIKLYILSNSIFGKQVRRIASELGMKYYYNAGKPFLKGFLTIQKNENIQKENILMIGDQVFTDIWGGNRFGVKTILVRPINASERMHTKFKRPIEKVILRRMNKKGAK